MPAKGEDLEQSLPSLRLVHAALERLSPRLREAVVLFELEGLSLAEMAVALEIPLHTAASRLRRGREKLRVALQLLGCAAPAGLEGTVAAYGSERP